MSLLLVLLLWLLHAALRLASRELPKKILNSHGDYAALRPDCDHVHSVGHLDDFD